MSEHLKTHAEVSLAPAARAERVLAEHAKCGREIDQNAEGIYWAAYECGATVPVEFSTEGAERAHVVAALSDAGLLTDGAAYDAQVQHARNWHVQYEHMKAERDALARWKSEALPILVGLQELGNALGLPLGEQITGPAAVEAVEKLKAERDAARISPRGREPVSDINGHFCGQTQPHAAHVWHTPPDYGSATFITEYQCAGFSGTEATR